MDCSDSSVYEKVGRFNVRTYHDDEKEYFLGNGSYADVFKAFSNGILYAAKRISVTKLSGRVKDIPTNEHLPYTKNIKHGNIITIFHSEKIGGFVWIIMECCMYNLFQYLEQKKPEPNYRAAILIQSGSVVEYLHKKGLVHRDIKPDNFLIKETSSWPWLKLTDFGFAKDLSIRDSWMSTVRGNFHWLAPELLDEDGNFKTNVHAKFISVDMYSLGLVYAFVCMDKAGQDFISRKKCCGVLQNTHSYLDLVEEHFREHWFHPELDQVQSVVKQMLSYKLEDRPLEVSDRLKDFFPDAAEAVRQYMECEVPTVSATDDAMVEYQHEEIPPSKVDSTPVPTGQLDTTSHCDSNITPLSGKLPYEMPVRSTKQNAPLTLIGGHYRDTDVNTSVNIKCWHLDDFHQSWHHYAEADMPEQFFRHAICKTKQGFLVLGGQTQERASDACHHFIEVSKTWVKLKNMPTARAASASVRLGDDIYALGGIDKHGDDWVPIENCESLDIERNEWTLRLSMLPGMMWPLAVVLGNSIFVLFHDHPYNKLKRDNEERMLQEYNPVANKWTIKKPLPENTGLTDGARAIALSDSIIVAGGAEKICVKYTVSTNQWTSLTPPRCHHIGGALALYNGKIMLLGGKELNEKEKRHYRSDIIEQYSPESNEWEDSTIKLPKGLSRHTVFMLDAE